MVSKALVLPGGHALAHGGAMPRRCVLPRKRYVVLLVAAATVVLLIVQARDFDGGRRMLVEPDQSYAGSSGSGAAAAAFHRGGGASAASDGECPVCLPCSERSSAQGRPLSPVTGRRGSSTGHKTNEGSGRGGGSGGRNVTLPVAHVQFQHPHLSSTPTHEYWAPGTAADRVSFPFIGRERGSFERITNNRSPRAPLLLRRRALLAIPVSGRSKANVAPVIDLFHREGMDILLFHYDMSDWSDVEHVPAHTAVRAVGQTKFWFAKRYLGPHVLENYDYLFLWDDDVGLPDGWSPTRFLAFMQHYGLHVAQPALASGTVENPQFDVVRLHDDVSAAGYPGRLTTFVEVMFPVFSREAWRDCVWETLPYDGRSFWGVDNAWYPHCASAGFCRFGVVDSMPVHHKDTRTLVQNTDQNLQELAHYVELYKSTLCAPAALAQARRAADLEERDERAIAAARAAEADPGIDVAPPIVSRVRRTALRRQRSICNFIEVRPLGFDFSTVRVLHATNDRTNADQCAEPDVFPHVSNRPWHGDDPAMPLPVPKF